MRERERERVRSNLVLYAQSTITVISGRYTFCRYTITVKNRSMLKTYICILRALHILSKHNNC